jgi:hypothetical protein
LRHATAARRRSAFAATFSLSLQLGTSELTGRPGISFGARPMRSRYAALCRGAMANQCDARRTPSQSTPATLDAAAGVLGDAEADDHDADEYEVEHAQAINHLLDHARLTMPTARVDTSDDMD